MISLSLCSCSNSLEFSEFDVNMRELGVGLLPAEEPKPPPNPRPRPIPPAGPLPPPPPLNPPPPPPPTFRDGRGRAGLFAQEPAGLDAPDDKDGGPGPALTLFSRPGMDRAFILARISSAFAFMMVGLGNVLPQSVIVSQPRFFSRTTNV